MESNKIILIGLVGIILLSILFVNYNILEKKEYAVKFEIGGSPGFDLNSTALTFGRIPFGSSSTRSILIKNDFDRTVFVSLSSSKEISSLLSISENDFFLKSGENKTLSFFVYSYPNITAGKYEGDVKLVVSRYRGIFNGKS